jgi:hypothetical protein
MRIKVEVTADEMAEMGADTVAELEEALRHQLDNCTDDEGGAGVDWMVSYDFEIVQVDS